MKKFFVLVKKEVKELLTPQMLVPLLVVVLVFVFIGKVVGKQTQKNTGASPVTVVDLDRSAASNQLIASARQNGLEPIMHDTGDAAELMRSDRTKSAIVIPAGFGGQVESGQSADVRVYTVISNFSLLGSKPSQQVVAALNAASLQMSTQYAGRFPGANAAVFRSPLKPVDTVIVGSRQAQVSPSAIAGLMTGQATLIPIILFLVITLSSQLIAVSMATEKENKTLETLLSTPVSRRALVAAKLIGAGLVALLTSVVYMFGMRYYLQGMTGGSMTTGSADAATHAAAAALGLTFSAQDYILLGLVLFLAILVALSIAIILGSFAEDAKSAQGVVAPLMVLTLVPYFLTLMVDISTLPAGLRAVVLAIPFSHAFLAAPNLMLHHYGQLLWGMAYLAVLFVVFVLLASRLFASEKILTMKLSFKKRS